MNGTHGDFDFDCEHLTPLTALTKLVLVGPSVVDEPGLALQLVPLQQLHVETHAVERMQTVVGNGCEVIPL